MKKFLIAMIFCFVVTTLAVHGIRTVYAQDSIPEEAVENEKQFTGSAIEFAEEGKVHVYEKIDEENYIRHIFSEEECEIKVNSKAEEISVTMTEKTDSVTGEKIIVSIKIETPSMPMGIDELPELKVLENKQA